ncbi:MAG: Bacterial alpha-L-rhamnosidase [Lentisphaerae bacterium ADurb.Bin242]|nr:MAG: Bacterial alpha-L-rhamnosidase [Lentisphaerae bacterium ADurb.Bin242]
MSSLLCNFYDPFSFSAVWISLPEAVRPNFCMQGTRGFQYEPGPEKAILRIAAESYYRLFINGFFVGNGPVRGTCSVNYFDAYDISGLLRKGDNRIGVVVQSMNSTQSFNSHPAGCAFIAELPGVLATGTDWKIRPTPGWIHTEHNFTLQHGYKIEYDLRKEDRGWLDGTGTGTWADAIVFHNAALNAKRLSPRGIPPLRETDFTPELLIAAETVPEDVPEGEDIGDVLNREVWHDNTDRVVRSGEDQYTLLPGEGGATLIFDFGRECTGYLEVEIEAAAGTRLDITYGEDLWHGRVRASFRATGYKEMYFFTDTYYLRDGLNSVGNYFLEHGASLVQLSFRNMTGPVYIRKIVYHDCRFPYRAAARFHCSDPVLDRIWDICRETLELCTTDVFEDCPWREHAFWVNDLVVENLTSLTLFGAAAVHRRAFDLAFSQQYPSGWCPGVAPTARNESKPSNILPATNFFLFKILEDYYRESGDLATVKRTRFFGIFMKIGPMLGKLLNVGNHLSNPFLASLSLSPEIISIMSPISHSSVAHIFFRTSMETFSPLPSFAKAIVLIPERMRNSVLVMSRSISCFQSFL